MDGASGIKLGVFSYSHCFHYVLQPPGTQLCNMHMPTLSCLGQSLKDHQMYGQMFQMKLWHYFGALGLDKLYKKNLLLSLGEAHCNFFFFSLSFLWEYVLGSSSFIAMNTTH